MWVVSGAVSGTFSQTAYVVVFGMPANQTKP
mgnify:CR=1 FL=1